MPRPKPLVFATTNEKKIAIQKLKEDVRIAKERVNSIKGSIRAQNIAAAAKMRELLRLEKQNQMDFTKANDALAKAVAAAVEVDGRSKAARAVKVAPPAPTPATPPTTRKRRVNGQAAVQGA